MYMMPDRFRSTSEPVIGVELIRGDLASLGRFESLIFPDKERLASLQQQLGARHEQWAERITASIEEDYRQLLKDLGCG
jgi:hypothetical protein